MLSTTFLSVVLVRLPPEKKKEEKERREADFYQTQPISGNTERREPDPFELLDVIRNENLRQFCFSHLEGKGRRSALGEHAFQKMFRFFVWHATRRNETLKRVERNKTRR